MNFFFPPTVKLKNCYMVSCNYKTHLITHDCVPWQVHVVRTQLIQKLSVYKKARVRDARKLGCTPTQSINLDGVSPFLPQKSFETCIERFSFLFSLGYTFSFSNQFACVCLAIEASKACTYPHRKKRKRKERWTLLHY